MSEIIVQKFGGTSVGSVDRIDAVAEIIKKASMSQQIIVVVSAMSGETNKLVNLANHFGKNPDKREFDALVSTGETISSALLAMALHSKGINAKSYSASQISMKTTDSFSKAKILDVDAEKILNVINDGGWHFTNLKTPEEMYEKFMNFGHHDEFRLSGITVEKIREKITNKEMFYDHFADKSSSNKWESNYKLKLLNEKMLPKFLIENKNKYIEWFSN